MSTPIESKPIPGIREIFLAGFLTENVSNLYYLVITGRLWECDELRILGDFLRIGLSGLLAGNVTPLLAAGARKA